MKYTNIIGGYFTVLGWISLAGLIVGILIACWTDSLYLDFSFIFLFWLGYELKKGNSTARKWAIGISSFVATCLIIMLFVDHSKIYIGGQPFSISNGLYYSLWGVFFVVYVLPGVMLLSQDAKKEFEKLPKE